MTSRPALLLIGSLPPPVDGQSVAFSLLERDLRAAGVALETFDLSPRRDELGFAGSLRRSLDYVEIIPRYTLTLLRHRPRSVYITLSQSRRGFLRDACFVWLASIVGARVIGHVHGGNYGAFYDAQGVAMRCWIRATLRRAEALIVLGEGLRKMFSFDPTLARRIRVVANGIPPRNVARGAKSLPRAGRPVNLLFLSNLIESKGYLDLLEAVRILVREHGLEVACVFCGAFLPNASDDRVVVDAQQARRLFDDFVSQHRLDASVEYRGVVDGEEKAAALDEAHFLVLPTRYDAEGQPISIIEAMRDGCVVVATDYRAIPDLVENGVTGRLLTAGKGELARELADTIRELAATPDRFSAMSRAAIDRFGERFTARRHLDHLRAILLPEDAPKERAETPPRAH